MANSSIFRIGILGTAAALLLSGCVTDGDGMDRATAKPIVAPTPIALETKSKATSLYFAAVETDALSLPQPATWIDAPQRLALLQATARPAVPTKAAAFSALTDGPLSGDEIEALFSGLEVTTDDGVPENHRFKLGGTVIGSTIADSGVRPENGTSEDDSATWSVSKKGQLCMDWFDWYSGDKICFSVSKQDSQLVLTGGNYSIRYDFVE